MRKITQSLLLILMCLSYSVSSQDIDFNLRYNGNSDVYEVYAKPAFSNPFYFVGGGSQITVVLPESLGNVPLSINTVNGGLWSDNSQVYAPTADPLHDFHSIASNGSPITFLAGEELLLFTFTIQGGGCTPDLRLFENGIDPDSNQPGMGGGDFDNFFAVVFDPFNNNWRSNYFNTGLICPEPPVVISNPLTIPQDSTGTLCMPILDNNPTDTFTATLCTGSPTNGSAITTVSGNTICVEYTPTTGFSGTDDICIIVCDISGECDTVSVPVTVIPAIEPSDDDEPPVVIVTPIVTPQDSSVNVCTVVLDPNIGDIFTATNCTGSPTNGTATPTINGNSLCLEYTPNTGYIGDDDICVIVCDQTGLCDTVSVPVNIIPTPGPIDSLQVPIIVMPPLVGPEDSIFTTCGTIIDPNIGDTHTVTICEQPSNATATAAINNADNELCITLEPSPEFTGSDSICVIVCDQTNLCDTLTIPIEIIPGNDAPLAINDINSTQVNNPVDGNVLLNDSDQEGDNLIVNTTPLNVTNGSVVIDALGNYTFTPDPGFIGTASFQYEVCDDGNPSACDMATVVIEVLDNSNTDNNDVVGLPDNFISEGANTLTANVLANDSDPDGDNLIINTTPVTSPTNGVVVINPDGTIMYTPSLGFTGTEVFSYEVCDDGIPVMCDTVDVTIEVVPENGVNDLYATDDVNMGEEDELINGNVILNDNDPENGMLTVGTTPVSPPTNGTLTLNADGTYVYEPNPGFTGNDQFVYEVCDDGVPVACDQATVYLTILDAKDAPVVITNPITISEDSTGTVCMNITDPNVGDTFTASLCTSSPTNGTATTDLVGNTLCLDYTPTTGYTGTDEVCLIVCDQTGRCDTVSVPVTIVPNLTPTTDPTAPVVVVTPITTTEDSTVNLCTPILDPNIGDTFSATICTGTPEHGSATPTIIGSTLCLEYEPTTGYTGDDEVCIIVCDQTGLCDTVSVPVVIVPNPEPSDSMQTPIVIMPPVVGPEDSTIVSCGTIIDPNVGDTHTVSICEQPSNATITAVVDNTSNELCLTLDPDPNFTGRDSVCVIVCDQTGLCDSLIVPIEILPGNDAPLAVNDINNSQMNTSTNGNVLTNDSDPEGHNMTVNTTPINPMNGTVTIDTDGNYTFTPDPGFVGTATFEYEVCDDGAPVACDTALVSIEVIGVPDPSNNTLIGMPDNFVTENDNLLTGDLLANDSDPEGDNLIINTTPVTSPTNGVLVINPDGTFVYTPDAGTTGEDTFSYQVCDDGTPVACDTVAVTIEVIEGNGVNDLYATDDANVGNKNEKQTGNVILNDNDPESGVLTVTTTPLSPPSNGSLTLNADGTYIYEPNIGFVGNDQFTYLVCDDGTPIACDSATVYFTVLNLTTELRLKVMLHGALFGSTDNLMRADLVSQDLVPLVQPYNVDDEPLYTSRYQHVIGGNEVTSNAVLTANAGTPDGIVDWIFIELRDATDSVTVLRTISALVQRDGDIVDAATGGALNISDLPDEFFVVVKHRNHLGAMTASTVETVNSIATFDFTTAGGTDLYDDGTLYNGLEQVSISGHRALWAGNSNADGKVKYDGTFNDRIIIAGDVLLAFGNGSNALNFNNAVDYYQGDINMDGKAKYDGFGNDRILLQAITLSYTLNTSYLNNYDLLIEQIK